MIKNWFKFFGLSFFTDKYSREAPKFGFTAVFISLLLSFVFFACGYIASDTVPFATHYDNAKSYKEFISGAVEGGLELEISGKTAKSPVIINTFTDADAAAKYSKNGYNLIVDTRPSDSLVGFTQVAVKGESEISYENYLELSDKTGYEIKTRYTDELLEITPERVAVYTAYFEKACAEGTKEYDEKAAADYKKHKEDGGSDTELYYLYVRHYYTGVSSMLYGAKAPVLRDYYYDKYIKTDTAYYLFVFDDMLAGSFKTEGGVPVVYGGYFDGCAQGRVTDIHGFIKGVYYGSVGRSLFSYLVSSFSLLSMLVFIPLAIALALFLIGKAVKKGWEKSFSGCYKITSSFVWASALITALVTFACGFFASARILYSLMPVIFGAILVIRAGIYCVLSVLKNKNQTQKDEQKYNDIFGGNL